MVKQCDKCPWRPTCPIGGEGYEKTGTTFGEKFTIEEVRCGERDEKVDGEDSHDGDATIVDSASTSVGMAEGDMGSRVRSRGGKKL